MKATSIQKGDEILREVRKRMEGEVVLQRGRWNMKLFQYITEEIKLCSIDAVLRIRCWRKNKQAKNP